MLHYKKIDIKNSIEDIFALAKIFYMLGKYQQCSKSKENVSIKLTIVPKIKESFCKYLKVH